MGPSSRAPGVRVAEFLDWPARCKRLMAEGQTGEAMSYCKHQWEDRTAVLREVFRLDDQRRSHGFYVCSRCLRIDEVRPEMAGLRETAFEWQILPAA